MVEPVRGSWAGQPITFHLSLEPPRPPSYVLAFVRSGDCFVVADIPGRGWCVPSGHIEAGETALEAAERELMEEAGTVAKDLRPFGYFQLHSEEVAMAFVGELLTFPPHSSDSRSSQTSLMGLDELPEHYAEWSGFYESIFRLALQL